MAHRLPRPRRRGHPGSGRLAARRPVLDAHAPAPPARRPRTAARRARSAAPRTSGAASADAPARRAPRVGGPPRRLAPDTALRRGAPPRVAARAPAPHVLPRRDAPLDRDPRASPRARLVHHGVEAPLRRRDVARLAHALAGSSLVEPPVLQRPHAR